MSERDRKKEPALAENDTQAVTKRQVSGRLLRNWLLLAGLFTLAIIVSGYMISPLSEVNEVSVDGNTEVYDQTVLENSGILSGDEMLDIFMNRGDIGQKISAGIPQVAEATLKVTGLQSVNILIKEYETEAFLLNEGEYYQVLENGVILDQVIPRASSSGRPILVNFEQGSTLERMLEEFQDVDERVKSLISEVEHRNSERNPMLIRIFMNDGNEVMASIPTFAERINYYTQMREAVDGQSGVFDLEAGAFFIPFDSEVNEELDLLDENEELTEDEDAEE
ncbi:Cell division protein FtsQ [Alkalibacterium sp. AK22]|uniref:cell division protein FtsQ/DivIB n=1 Tax=Alkalibacterium sp. AK22 TaxID=1229520 RepID=UPI000447B5CC|nr:cell division protein FtsQ/DivIB [Alkalibacterium sp. AK22]EXJ22855.1 Cell division protein FtsQ [Alkalibacterium sp. AK22]